MDGGPECIISTDDNELVWSTASGVSDFVKSIRGSNLAPPIPCISTTDPIPKLVGESGKLFRIGSCGPDSVVNSDGVASKYCSFVSGDPPTTILIPKPFGHKLQ
jgi:hypothetical protein